MKKDQTFIRSLKRWISGNAGLQQERELQQLAQDDPFMADALEGFQSTAGEDHEQHLQRLRKRLAMKEEKRRGLPIWMKVAAGGAILIAALFALQVVNAPQADQIGQTAPAVESTESDPPSVEQDEVTASEVAAVIIEEEATPSTPTPGVEAKDAVQAEAPSKSRKKAPSLPRKVIAKGEKEEMTQEEADQDRLASSELAAETIAQEAEELPTSIEEEPIIEEKPVASRTGKALARKREQTISSDDQEDEVKEVRADQFSPRNSPKTDLGIDKIRKISGLVTNPNGKPLIGAAVAVPNTNIGTVTDYDGRYNLSLDGNAQELQFSYVGFQQTKVPLPQIDTYDIRLSPEFAPLAEVTLSNSNKRKSQKPSQANFSRQAIAKALSVKDLNAIGVSPTGGLNKLNRTLRNRARKLDVHYSQIGQAVSLTFTVGPGNKIENLRIVESKGLILDQEAIRLIQLTSWELEPAYRLTGASVYCKVQF